MFRTFTRLAARFLALAYVLVVTILAVSAVSGSDEAFTPLIVMTLPLGYFVNFGILILDSLGGSVAPWPALFIIAVAAYVSVAVLNLVILRALVSSCRDCRLLSSGVTPRAA
jgi:hypothetical protein